MYDISGSVVMRKIFLFVAFLLIPATAGAQNFFDTFGGTVASCLVAACIPSVVKGNVDAAGDHLEGDAKQLYNDVMNDFIKNRLPEMLSQIDSLATKHEEAVALLLSNVNDIINRVIAGIQSGIKDISKLVQMTSALANEFANKIVCQVQGSAVQLTADADAGIRKIVYRYVPLYNVVELLKSIRDECLGQYGQVGVHEPVKAIELKMCEIHRWIANSKISTLQTSQVRAEYADLLDLIFVEKCLPHDESTTETLKSDQSKVRGLYLIWRDALGEGLR
jgi:hypothetical protein